MHDQKCLLPLLLLELSNLRNIFIIGLPTLFLDCFLAKLSDPVAANPFAEGGRGSMSVSPGFQPHLMKTIQL